MSTELMTFDYQGQQVVFDPSVQMWNLNAMHQAAGSVRSKEPTRWLTRVQARELLAALANRDGLHDSDTTKTYIQVRKGGASGGGTWAHWQIAAAYAHYLRPEFYIQWNEWALERVQQLQAPQPKLLPAERVIDSIAAMTELIREHFELDAAWRGPGQMPCMAMKEIIGELYAVGALVDRPKYHMEHGNTRRRYYEELAYEALQGLAAHTMMRYRGTRRFYLGVWPKRWPRTT
jgi:hypothetical protein